MLKPVNSPWGLVEKEKTRAVFREEVTPAGRYQGRAFPSCQVIFYETCRRKKKTAMSSLYRRMDGWVLGADFIFLEQMPGPTSVCGLGGVQFRESIKVLCSLALLPPPAPAAPAKVEAGAKDAVSGPAGASKLRSFVSRQAAPGLFHTQGSCHWHWATI